MMADRFTLKHWRGTELGIERVYVTDQNGDTYGCFQRTPDSKDVSWNGMDGGSPEVLDAILADQRLGRHANWRAASEDGDHDPIWWALLFAAGVR